MKQFLVRTIAMLLVLLPAPRGWTAENEIVIEGTGDSQQLLRILASAFEKTHPGAQVKIPDAIGSSGGIKAVADGKCDLARVAREIKEKEKIFNLKYLLFAWSPAVFVASPNVKNVASVTAGQVVGIFSGQVTSWKDLDCADQKIFVAQREAGDSTRIMLEKNLPGWKEIRHFAGEEVYTTPELIDIIAQHDNTIGYAPLSMARPAGLSVLKYEGLDPSVENVVNGSYPLKVPFALVWKGELAGLARDFVDFTRSSEGQKIIAENGAVPIP